MKLQSNTPASVNLSIETVLEEIKPVFTKKHLFDIREELIAVFGIVGLSGICCKDAKK